MLIFKSMNSPFGRYMYIYLKLERTGMKNRIKYRLIVNKYFVKIYHIPPVKMKSLHVVSSRIKILL